MAIKKVKSWSWSKIDLFRSCPQAFELVYLAEVPRRESQPLITGRRFHELAEQYLKILILNGERTNFAWAEQAVSDRDGDDVREVWEGFWNKWLMPEDVTDVGVERQLAFNKKWKPVDWLAKDAYYRLIIDWHYRQGDLGVVEDWKTGRNVPRSLEKDLQTRSYGFGLLKAVYPDVENVLLRHNYVRFNRPPVEILLEPADLKTVPEEIAAEVSIIEAEKNFDPRPGSFCSWCGVQEHCPAMSRALVPAEVRVPITLADAEKAASLLLRLKEMENLLAERLKDWVKTNGPITVGDLSYGPTEVSRIDLDTQAIVELLLAEGLERDQVWPLLNITKTKLSAGLKRLKRKDLIDRALELGEEKISERIEFKKVKEA